MKIDYAALGFALALAMIGAELFLVGIEYMFDFVIGVAI